MSDMEVDISIQAGAWDRIGNAEAVVREAARAAAAAVGGEQAVAAGRQLEVSVTLGDDPLVRELNRSYRGFDKATNVLSFPQPAPGGTGGDMPAADRAPAHLIGDIVLAYETIERESGAAGLAVAQHLAHLVVHGMLHLFGYDHEEDGQAADMEAMETRILAGIGVPDPYGSGGAGNTLATAGQDR
ncbi:MAG TPA: rRNA maturation RNase YbeY [Hyphomicrobiales bacterium]|nr:rRNA maturation RNase YbeY [Rhodobiaceae bacterium]HXK54100.1 rRNA maturation RNase YbeY [Hyphomicrobiales bacterium]